MSPAPSTPAVAQTWYHELAVAQPADAERGWPLLILLGGLGAAFGPLHDLVRDTDDGPGWSALWAADRCPAWALPWALLTIGEQPPRDATEAELRALLADPPHFKRGTVAAFTAAIKATLTAPKQLTLYERQLSPYRVIAITYTAQTPDAAATARAAASEKPLGLLLSARVYDGQDYQQLADNEATYADVDSDYASYDDVSTDMSHVPL